MKIFVVFDYVEDCEIRVPIIYALTREEAEEYVTTHVLGYPKIEEYETYEAKK